MNILVVGGGGREHTLVWKLARETCGHTIFAAPGNGGICGKTECLPVKDTDFAGLLEIARGRRIDLTVVGPEVPLAAGIADLFATHNFPVFGPSRRAAALESSKLFAKQFMKKYGVPSAAFDEADTLDAARSIVAKRQFPLVIKYEGLAAGKGVKIAAGAGEADEFLVAVFEHGVFDAVSPRVIIEDCLEGPEISYLVFTDGEHFLPMVPAQDYKRAYDGDLGPNTGGMGAWSPPSFLSDALRRTIETTIVHPTLRGIQQENFDYRGVLYFGLMLTRRGPFVLEYNVRFGDPETQVILPRLENDLTEVMLACVERRLSSVTLKWKKEPAVCVILASGGYPGHYETGREITGLDRTSGDVMVFHAGTRRDGDRIVTSGGRVLGISALAPDIARARAQIYRAAEAVQFEGKHYRRDIAL